MLGIIFAFFTALFESLKDLSGKKSLQNFDEYVVAWFLSYFSFVFVSFIFLFSGFPEIGKGFWMALIINGPLLTLATVLYMKAIKSSDLSLTVPMVTFTPLFLLLSSPIILGEFPSLLGFFGVITIFLGSYILSTGRKGKNPGFFNLILTEKGPALMLLVAFIWSITSNFDKIGVQNSSPLFWVWVIGLFLTISLFPIVVSRHGKKEGKIWRNHYKIILLVGLFEVFSKISQMIAINLTLVTYVISIKRLSVVIVVVFGYFFFKEKNIKQRLIGATIMVFGVILIVFS